MEIKELKVAVNTAMAGRTYQDENGAEKGGICQ